MVLQVLSLVLHCVMYPGSVQDVANKFMLTNTIMIVLHFATAIITSLILVAYARQPIQFNDKQVAAEDVQIRSRVYAESFPKVIDFFWGGCFYY